MMQENRTEAVDFHYPDLLQRAKSLPLPQDCSIYGIPNGGIYAALLAVAGDPSFRLVEHPENADVFIDDIVDSGRTRAKYEELFPKTPFLALIDKTGEDSHFKGTWISFPWERANGHSGPEENITRLIQYLGDDPTREGLLETPARVIRSYKEMFSGYKKNPQDVFKSFEDGACQYQELILSKNISFASFCEHHILPFRGVAHIAYIPNGRLIGLSKLSRLLEVFAKRLQVQERLTTQVTEALDEYLIPKGSACIIEAEHACMACRGVNKQNSSMVTSSLTGVFRDDLAARAELLQLIKG